MSWPHHIGETHQPDWVVYVRDSEKFRLTNVISERIIFVSWGIIVSKFIRNAVTSQFLVPVAYSKHRNFTTSIAYLKTSWLYRVSQEEFARLPEGVPYVKVYLYNPKHLCPKLNGYGDNGKRKVWSSGGSTHCTCQLTTLSMSVLECGVILRQFSSRSL